jgi:alpha-galactosidase
VLSTGEVVIMMLNKGRAPADLTVTFEQMGFDQSTHVTAYDLWKHATVPLDSKTNQITLPVESHGVTMIRVTPVKG